MPFDVGGASFQVAVSFGEIGGEQAFQEILCIRVQVARPFDFRGQDFLV
jgi:hypothetical protein